MKLTLWRQFSSNHSAHYTVVGQFATAEQAQSIKAELVAMLSEVGAWWGQWEFQEAFQIFQDHYEYPPVLTPPEEAIKARYQLRGYKVPLDWCWDIEAATLAVQTVKDMVIVDSPVETWGKPYAFVEFMQYRGGNVHFEWRGDYSGRFLNQRALNLRFVMTCKYEEEDAVDALWKQISHSTDYANKVVFQLPGFSSTRGTVERENRYLHFRDVSIHGDFYRQNRPSFEQQLQAVFDFVEQYPCTIKYNFIHESGR